jgi:fatty acid desaturase
VFALVLIVVAELTLLDEIIPAVVVVFVVLAKVTFEEHVEQLYPVQPETHWQTYPRLPKLTQRPLF